MYKPLKKLLDAGYEVSFRPLNDTADNVNLTVREAKNGTCRGVEVDLNILEWAFAEQGITARLEEAIKNLID